MNVMQKKREEMKKGFLALTPLHRIRQMSNIFNDIIIFKAKTKGVTEYEIYKEYIKKDDYDTIKFYKLLTKKEKSKTLELAKLIRRDKKLKILLKPKKVVTEKEDKEQLIR